MKLNLGPWILVELCLLHFYIDIELIKIFIP